MLGFFRKYQKLFFIFVTTVIVISFTFFGTYSVIPSADKREDVLLAKGVDGSKIMRSEIEKMVRFITTCGDDVWTLSLTQCNLANDGVVQKDFFATGLGTILFENYFSDLQNESAERLQKIKQYRPYTHPQAPFLQAEAVWQRAKPEILEGIRLLKQEEAPSSKQFSLLVNLYQQQAQFPPELLRNILNYQKTQYAHLQKDTSLSHANLSLFGFQTLQDWVGPKYLQLVAQFLHNAAVLAKEKGYVVTKEEAKSDLLKNTYENLKKVSQEQTYENAYTVMKQQIRLLGMEEKEAVELWQKVLLFRRLFDDVGHKVLLDPLLTKDFMKVATEQVSVEMYEMPAEFQCQDLLSLCRLQFYLESVGNNYAKNSLLFPASFISAEQVEKKCPELVERSVTVEYAEVDKHSLGSKISLKELWSWQTEDSSWNYLREHFPELRLQELKEKEKRFSFIHNLPKDTRDRLDALSLEKMIEAHPQWVQEALQQAPMKKKEMKIRAKGGEFLFQGIENRKEFLSLLEKAPKKDEKDLTEKDQEIKKMLQFYSGDDRHFYKISVLSFSSAPKILSWKEASFDETFTELFDEHLQAQYVQLSKRNLPELVKSSGAKKTFEEAKEETASIHYADLLQAIHEDYKRIHPKDTLDLSTSFYTQHRFYKYLRLAKASIEKNLVDSPFLQLATSFENQGKLQKREKTFDRGAEKELVDDSLFSLPEKSWSNVEKFSSGKLAFCQVLEKKIKEETPFAKIDKEKEALMNDAKRCLMEELLEKVKTKNAINIQNGVDEPKE